MAKQRNLLILRILPSFGGCHLFFPQLSDPYAKLDNNLNLSPRKDGVQTVLMLLLIFALLSCGTGDALAGGPGPATSGPEAVVAVVKEVPEGEWTNGNPPVVDVEVEEVLCGKCVTGAMKVRWGPAPCPIDFSSDDVASKVQAWEQRKLVAPTIGEKWILWGTLKDGALVSRRDGRREPTEKNLAWARKEMARVRKEMAESELDRVFAKDPAKRAESQAKWRETIQSEDITTWAAQSHLVAIATYESGSFAVEEVLRGEPLPPYLKDLVGSQFMTSEFGQSGNRNRVTVALPRDRTRLLEKNGRYLLFLSERGMSIVTSCIYVPVGEGAIPISEAALKAVRKGVQQPRPRQAVVALGCVVPFDEQVSVARQIEEAVVVVVWIGHLHNKDGQLRTGIKGLDYSLNLERQNRDGDAVWHAQAASIATGRIVLDEWWKADTEAEHLAKTKEFVKNLVVRRQLLFPLNDN